MKIVQIFYWFVGAVVLLLIVAVLIHLGYRFLNWVGGDKKQLPR
jgi:hypothetical protein